MQMQSYSVPLKRVLLTALLSLSLALPMSLKAPQAHAGTSAPGLGVAFIIVGTIGTALTIATVVDELNRDPNIEYTAVDLVCGISALGLTFGSLIAGGVILLDGSEGFEYSALTDEDMTRIWQKENEGDEQGITYAQMVAYNQNLPLINSMKDQVEKKAEEESKQNPVFSFEDVTQIWKSFDKDLAEVGLSSEVIGKITLHTTEVEALKQL